MELFNGSNDSLSYFEYASTLPDTELELIFGSKVSKNPITKKVFISLLDKCKVCYELLSENISLDIRQEFRGYPSNVRCTINGKDSVKKYCKKDSLEDIDEENIEFVVKKYFKDKNQPNKKFFALKDENYNVRLNIKKEEPLLKTNKLVLDFLKDYDDKKKHFRYKKRYSFLTNDELFRIDLTVVKSTKFMKGKNMFETTFRKANILNNREEYELELEYIGDEKINGIRKMDIMAKKLKNEYVITDPGNASMGNIYDPANLGIPMIKYRYEKSSGMIDGEEYEFDSPRFEPKGEYIPYTVSSMKYTKEEYSNMIGKYTNISDNYFRENNMFEVRDTIKEYYKKGKKITFIREVFEKISQDGEYIDTIAKVELLYKIGEYDELMVPIKDLYSGYFTIEEDKIIKISEDDPDFKMSFPSPESDEEKSNIIKELLRTLEMNVIYLSKVIYNTDSLISYQLKESVLNLYMGLTEQKSMYFNFIGPQPVTLNFIDIQENNPKSIMTDYAVTEKADGERYELFITNQKGYLINAKSNVIDTGIEFTDVMDDWLFDGEYITKTKDNEDIKLYMIFDVYWAGKTTPQPIHTYPFVARSSDDISRKTVLDDFMKLKDNFIFKDESIEIDAKTYEFGHLSDSKSKKNKLKIFTASKKILKREEENYYPYEIDGLIYLPVRYSVKGNTEGVQSKYIGGTWNENFKWKPEHLNTIDFLGKVKKTMIKSKVVDEIFPIVHKNEEGVDEITEYKQLELFVGYNENDDDTINFCMKILEETKRTEKRDELKQFNFNSQEEDKYNFTNIVLKDGKMLCENGDEIKDNDIIELRYIKDAKNSMHWVPLRVRSDKLKPQYFNVANNVWDTIQKPITTEMIQAKENFNKIINQISDEDGKYYIKDTGDQLFESDKLRQLHNYIKSKLIGGITSSFNEPIKILDLSIGRGGDVKKFKNYSFILGLDISSNIHEACKRYYNTKSNVKGAFLRADTSKNIKRGECCNIVDNDENDRKHCDTMISILYDVKKPISNSYTNVNFRYRGIAKDGFHVVSSQFSMHYYFQNKTTFNGFIQNLAENVKKGGYFIGTCYDGMKIFDYFKDNDLEKLEYKEDTGKLVYSIEKKYDNENFDYNPDDDRNMLGNVVRIYMETIGQELDEYLVNFDHFSTVMKENGFVAVTPTNIPPKYSNLFRNDYFESDGFGSFENVISKIPEIDQSDNEFGKYYSEARSMNDEKNNELRLLSGFNKYFIFQKIK